MGLGVGVGVKNSARRFLGGDGHTKIARTFPSVLLWRSSILHFISFGCDCLGRQNLTNKILGVMVSGVGGYG